MPTSTYEIELLKRDQQIAGLLQRNKELEEENKRLKQLLHKKGKSKESKKPEFKIDAKRQSESSQKKASS